MPCQHFPVLLRHARDQAAEVLLLRQVTGVREIRSLGSIAGQGVVHAAEHQGLPVFTAQHVIEAPVQHRDKPVPGVVDLLSFPDGQKTFQKRSLHQVLGVIPGIALAGRHAQQVICMFQ